MSLLSWRCGRSQDRTTDHTLSCTPTLNGRLFGANVIANNLNWIEQ